MPILKSYHQILVWVPRSILQISLYRGYDNEENYEEQAITLPVAPSANKIIDVLDDQIVSTRQGGFQKFLIHWQNRPISDATWITATDF